MTNIFKKSEPDCPDNLLHSVPITESMEDDMKYE